MDNQPIAPADYDEAIRLLTQSIVAQIKAHRLLGRFSTAGLLETEDGRIARYDDDLARMRRRILQATEQQRKLKRAAARRREIDRERKKRN
jgi:hypothetical protein